MKWSPGTYKTEDLKARIEELLCLVEALASAHRMVGRIPLAKDMEELPVVVRAYQNLLENALTAYRLTAGEREESK